MNLKRLILSVIIGIIGGSVLFSILIAINMKSIDKNNLNKPKAFDLIGMNYLVVEKKGDSIEKQVNSLPISIGSIAIGGQSYVGLSFYSKKKNVV